MKTPHDSSSKKDPAVIDVDDPAWEEMQQQLSLETLMKMFAETTPTT